MNFASRLIAFLASMVGLGQHKDNLPAPGVTPTQAATRGAIRYQTRGGIWARRGLYVLPRLPNGEKYTTPDRRVCSPETIEQIKASAVAKRARRDYLRLVRAYLPATDRFVHSPGLLTCTQRLDRQARRAERKALSRGEIPS